MRKIFFTCVLSLLSYTVIGQPNLSVVWDYFDADRVLYNVNNFKVCFDGTVQCVTVPATGGIVMSDTTGGAVSYQTPLPTSQNNGNHSLTVAACESSTNCSDPVNLNYVVNKKPNSPIKVRVK